MTATQPVVEAARSVAAEVLWPAASEVDVADRLPVGHIDALADAGLWGLAIPAEHGGLGGAPATIDQVVAILAGACLPTAFGWIQHLGLSGRVAATPGALCDELVSGLASGTIRGGVALGGAREVAEPLIATPTSVGWRLDGPIPWITGWGQVDVFLVAAQHDHEVIWLVVDAADLDAAEVHPFDLVATNAARSVAVRLDGVDVGAERVLGRGDRAAWLAADDRGLGTNAALSVGVAQRCAALLDEVGESTSLHDDLVDLQKRLSLADPRHHPGDPSVDGSQLAELRAEASLLAWRAAGTLATATGGRGLATGGDTERLVRWAQFCLVFGSRAEIRAAQLAQLR